MGRAMGRWAFAAVTFASWLLFASPAAAVVPPSPLVTTPATADFTVAVSDQPIHFAGTVAGPVGPNDHLFIANFTVNPADPPIRCDILLSGSTTWACDAAPAEAIGDYELRVTWFAPDAPFGDTSAPTVLMLHVVPDAAPPPPPPPPPSPSATPRPRPTETENSDQTDDSPKPKAKATSAPAPLPPPIVVPSAVPNKPEQPAAQPPAPATVHVAPVTGSFPPWRPTDHPKVVLGIGIASFTLLTLIGPGGLAMGSAGSATLAAAAAAGSTVVGGSRSGKKGSVKSAKVKLGKFAGEGAGPGDSSITWRMPGWATFDAWGTAAPLWLATRSPLLARILVDGAYLRAMFGSAWTLGALGGFVLGLTSAHQSGGLPVPIEFGLTAALLVLAVFDATWGAFGVIGFALGMMIWRSTELGIAPTIRAFLGLAALWFAIPLIAAAARPFRRRVDTGQRYAWDRLADAVIASLIAGWATQKTVGGLPGLSGLDLPIAHHANALALLAIAAVLVRVLAEELAAWRYPLRLDAAAPGKLPFSDAPQRLLGTALRTALFVFLSIAFIGNCWQLWLGTLLFAVPQLLSIYERSFPNSVRLKQLLPEGIVKILVMLIIGTLFARLVFAMLNDPASMLRNGFVLLSLPGLVLTVFGLFGRDGPDPTWTWPRQVAGVFVLLATLWLVLTGW